MNPITKILGYALALVLITQGLTGWWLDRDEKALGAVPAEIQAARAQDANAANTAVLSAVTAAQATDQHDRDLAVAAQAKADQAHEKAMLGIQHRQDLAAAYFGDASHDTKSAAWGAQPVPLSDVLGMCAALGDNTDGCSEATGSQLGAPSPGGGTGPHGGDGPGHQHHGQSAQGARQRGRGAG